MRECPLFGVVAEYTMLVYTKSSTEFLPAEGLLWGHLENPTPQYLLMSKPFPDFQIEGLLEYGMDRA